VVVDFAEYMKTVYARFLSSIDTTLRDLSQTDKLVKRMYNKYNGLIVYEHSGSSLYSAVGDIISKVIQGDDVYKAALAKLFDTIEGFT